jgi:hypothetical protein
MNENTAVRLSPLSFLFRLAMGTSGRPTLSIDKTNIQNRGARPYEPKFDDEYKLLSDNERRRG